MEVEEAGEALPAGRLLLAAQAPRNLLPRTVLEVVRRPPFPQVSSLQDVHLVEARDPKFMGIGMLSFANVFIHCLFSSFSGSMEVVTQESQEEAWPGVDFHSYSGPWLGEAWLALEPRHTCTTQRSVTSIDINLTRSLMFILLYEVRSL